VHASASPSLITAAPARNCCNGFGLVLVVALIFLLLAWLLRRMQQIGPRRGQVIKLVASEAWARATAGAGAGGQGADPARPDPGASPLRAQEPVAAPSRWSRRRRSLPSA
jgi:hypothetical protein